MNQNGWSEEIIGAIKYYNLSLFRDLKNACVPKYIYKFIPLYDESWCNYQDENDKRLKSLETQTIWASKKEKLNDPYEFHSISYDETRIKNAGWKLETIKKCIDLFSSSLLISCFSNADNARIPLWAHYSNGHKGFCIKYEVVDISRQYFIISFVRLGRYKKFLEDLLSFQKR